MREHEAITAYLEVDDAGANDASAPVWAVRTESDAAWAADKILTARQRLERIKAACAAQIAAAERDATRTEEYFLPLLEQWARANPPARGKTIRLPTGALGFRAVATRPRLADPDAALAWARDHLPEAVQVSERVLLAPLVTYLRDTGEVPTGVEMVPPGETFSVREV